MKSYNYRLQFITHHNERYSYIDSARLALEGGCRWIQLRIKGAEEQQLFDAALTVQRLCREYGATFIINDNVAIAKRIGADGVHLGKNDMPIAEARTLLGEGFIIGATVNTFDDITQLLKSATPDYFGCGPYRFTSTKSNLAPTLGIEGYSDIVQLMRHNGIDIPLVAIGGIGNNDIAPLAECGVDGIALSSSIIDAPHTTEQMREIVDLINRKYRPNTIK